VFSKPLDGHYKKRHEDSFSGTSPHVSTTCLPNVNACDQISQAFPIGIYIMQAIGGGNGLGKKLGLRWLHSQVEGMVILYLQTING